MASRRKAGLLAECLLALVEGSDDTLREVAAFRLAEVINKYAREPSQAGGARIGRYGRRG